MNDDRKRKGGDGESNKTMKTKLARMMRKGAKITKEKVAKITERDMNKGERSRMMIEKNNGRENRKKIMKERS